MSKNFRLVTLSFVILTLTGFVWVLVAQKEASTSVSSKLRATSSARRPAPLSKPALVPQLAVIRDPNLHWEERIHAVRDLPDKLDIQTIERLFMVLEQRPVAAEDDWYLVCNEIMEVLRKRSLAAEVYTSRHLDLVESSTADPVIRDYAAQHLGQWISGIDPNAHEQDPVRASDAFEGLCAEASNPANGQITLAGTILNTLADAVTNGNPHIRQYRTAIGQLALKILDSPEEVVSNFNRTTAIQVAARMHVPELPERCRSLARNEQAADELRLSAIAALGLVGDADDRELLQSFVNDEALKFAAAAAVERFDQKYPQP